MGVVKRIVVVVVVARGAVTVVEAFVVLHFVERLTKADPLKVCSGHQNNHRLVDGPSGHPFCRLILKACFDSSYSNRIKYSF